MKSRDDKPKSENGEAKPTQEISALQAAKQIKLQREAEAKELAENREKAERDERREYENQLRRDKVELMRKKQGLDADETDAVPVAVQKQSVGKRIRNFFYHNKWWLAMSVFVAAIVGYIVYDTVTQEKYDMYVMLLSCDNEMYYYQSGLLGVLEDCCEDVNGDGEVNIALLYYSPSPQAATNDIYYSNASSMAAQFSMGDTVLIIADDSLNDTIYPNDILADLDEYFDSEYIDGYAYRLNDSNFAKMCGYEGLEQENMYIGLRAVVGGKTYTKTMQRNFDTALDTLGKLIEAEKNY